MGSTLSRRVGTPRHSRPRFDEAHALVHQAIAARAMPGAQLSVAWRTADGFSRHDVAFGALTYVPGAPTVTVETPYDLASVTKPFVALALVRCARRGDLDLMGTLAACLPHTSIGAPDATLDSLASHRSELPAWRPYYQAVTPAACERGSTRQLIVSSVLDTGRETNGGIVRYSDVGYIALGAALEEVRRSLLTDIVRAEVTRPLLLDPVVHFRGVTEAWHSVNIAPTEQCPWRGRLIQGNVHDENAYAMEGIAGHAGLFGTAHALCTLGCAALDALDGTSDWLDSETMNMMTAPRPGGSHRLGWDGKSESGSSAGERASARTFGHLGFTGTSLWCEPEMGVVVSFVSNRVHPTRDNVALRALRPSLHDAIWRAFGH